MATLEADEGAAMLLKAGAETGEGDDNCCTRSLATNSGAKKQWPRWRQTKELQRC
ncbi:hypothetical protein NC652_000344 [Populus alba x Populus x berolinensis]|nr:hypothetical protein NC652_000344 [Populus alba x Populus x berolinensis]